MLSWGLTPREAKGLAIAPKCIEDAFVVSLAGTCDRSTLPLLEAFFDELHTELVRVRGQTVTLDCENLFFMNSSSVKCFITWLAKVKNLPMSNRYQVLVRTNSRLAWQRRSFDAICRFAPGTFTLHAQ